MRRLPVIALVCYVAGWGIGSTLGWLVWVSASGEGRFRL